MQRQQALERAYAPNVDQLQMERNYHLQQLGAIDAQLANTHYRPHDPVSQATLHELVASGKAVKAGRGPPPPGWVPVQVGPRR